MPPYIPKKGDFVILTFDPQSGHEQKGRRPALVVSNTLFNKHTGLALEIIQQPGQRKRLYVSLKHKCLFPCMDYIQALKFQV
ncbi:MAG TPA: type II toxin-antitoxin system PemK/MazF family toxin [bacterium]|nr:type II toxin-antitoxin system PemK/MazF family toxin [bacterium]